MEETSREVYKEVRLTVCNWYARNAMGSFAQTAFEVSPRFFLSRTASWYVFPPVGTTCIPGRISVEKEGGGIRWCGSLSYPQKAQKPVVYKNKKKNKLCLYALQTMSRILAGCSLHQHVLVSATHYCYLLSCLFCKSSLLEERRLVLL